MDWRTWTYEKVKNDAAVTTLVPEELIFAAFSIDDVPEVTKDLPKARPFMVLVFGNTSPLFQGVVSQGRFTTWVHDEVGSYLRIDETLGAVRESLVGPVSQPTAFCCEWEGDSGDLADDAMKTIVRTSSFLVTERH